MYNCAHVKEFAHIFAVYCLLFISDCAIFLSAAHCNINFAHVREYEHIHLFLFMHMQPGRVAQSIGHLTRKSGVLGSIPGLATYFRFSFRFFKKGSCQLLAKVRSTDSPFKRSKPAQESVARLTDRPDMILDVYRVRKTTIQQQQIMNMRLVNVPVHNTQ